MTLGRCELLWCSHIANMSLEYASDDKVHTPGVTASELHSLIHYLPAN